MIFVNKFLYYRIVHTTVGLCEARQELEIMLNTFSLYNTFVKLHCFFLNYIQQIKTLVSEGVTLLQIKPGSYFSSLKFFYGLLHRGSQLYFHITSYVFFLTHTW